MGRVFKQENEEGRRIKKKEWKKVLFAFTILCGNRWWKFYKINKERESDEGDNEEKGKNEEQFFFTFIYDFNAGNAGNAGNRWRWFRKI